MMADDRYKYPVPCLAVQGLANPRFADLSLGEVRKDNHRIIGGDKGDLWFNGYTLEQDMNQTLLYQAILVTTLELDDDEVQDVAEAILQESFNSIGIETVEHS